MKLNGYNYSRESLQKQLAQGHYFFVAFILNTNVIQNNCLLNKITEITENKEMKIDSNNKS